MGGARSSWDPCIPSPRLASRVRCVRHASLWTAELCCVIAFFNTTTTTTTHETIDARRFTQTDRNRRKHTSSRTKPNHPGQDVTTTLCALGDITTPTSLSEKKQRGRKSIEKRQDAGGDAARADTERSRFAESGCLRESSFFPHSCAVFCYDVFCFPILCLNMLRSALLCSPSSSSASQRTPS